MVELGIKMFSKGVEVGIEVGAEVIGSVNGQSDPFVDGMLGRGHLLQEMGEIVVSVFAVMKKTPF